MSHWVKIGSTREPWEPSPCLCWAWPGLAHFSDGFWELGILVTAYGFLCSIECLVGSSVAQGSKILFIRPYESETFLPLDTDI